PRLRALAAERLPHPTSHDSLDSIPAAPLILLGNEFLDALPVRQWIRRGDSWFERYIENGAFTDRPTQEHPDTTGDLVERSDAAHAFVIALATRLATTGGAALFLDYGPAASTPGHSLQAIRNGAPADPLADPGSADLTA